MASNDDELGRIASDPGTDWDTLHWIAENHPSLRAAVAENPATYPELRDALASLGDPEIDAALARRASNPPESATQSPETPTPAPPPEAPSDHTPTQDESVTAERLDAQDTGEVGPVTATQPGHHAQDAWFPGGSSASDQAAPGPSRVTSGAGYGAARPAPTQRRRSRAPKFILAVLLPVLVLVGLVAMALSLLEGGSPADAPAAEAPASSAPAEGGAEEPGEEPEPSPSPEPPTPDELRVEVAGLPEESSCDSPAEDGEVLAELASAASQEGRWVESSDGELVRDALLGLQENCDSTHAAALYLDLRESEETASALRGTVSDMGTAWIQTSFPAQGQPLNSFVSPNGNVLCELSDTLRCRVLQHSFTAPEGCTEGVTYAIRVDRTAEPDCENPVPQQNQPVLGYGQTASNEFFACTSFQSQMSCWNQLTGEGINLSASRNFTY
ncbi:hypothetical protein [Nesterenkonia sandarakina]|uniref:Leucine rich repeat variant domain-containing protein n=1 Tax=Nesterenkonia sandarakina TaxID=272918 RepID=A0A7Z0E8P4_9MICC|nr:hypothetical protein [Nesterenkonia sandarakina]NYJ16996.1 hypothetical protein [Nesterenkonia sandarakina]